MFWIYRNVLIQPVDPLANQQRRLSWGRGYVGIFLNSAIWGGTLILVLLAATKRRHMGPGPRGDTENGDLLTNEAVEAPDNNKMQRTSHG